ncbi:hypothetical protein LTR49_028674, partial [Elasticomyces elasticus]
MLACGPIIGKIYDNRGSRQLLAGGAVLQIGGILGASKAQKFYQLLLAQGICSPLGASIIFYSAVPSVTTWFTKRQGLAIGIATSGGSFGGILFPLVTYLYPA